MEQRNQNIRIKGDREQRMYEVVRDHKGKLVQRKINVRELMRTSKAPQVR